MKSNIEKISNFIMEKVNPLWSVPMPNNKDCILDLTDEELNEYVEKIETLRRL